MQTANGMVTAHNEVEVYSKDLGVSVIAYTLPKVPPVLSLGKLCREKGFRFCWEPDKLPVLQHVKSGRVIECSVDQDTPMVCLLYTSPSPRDRTRSGMPSSA